MLMINIFICIRYFQTWHKVLHTRGQDGSYPSVTTSA